MHINKNTGLSTTLVNINRKKYGTNSLKEEKKNSFFKLLIESFGDPIIKILLIALAVKTVFLFKDFDWFETLGILIAIFMASFISSISEYGSEKAFTKLQEESSKIKVKVKRDSTILEIKIDEVVKEDIIILETGDMVPADGYLIEGEVSVNSSSLNGESKEINKKSIFNLLTTPKEENKIYRGSTIYSGYALMYVTNVGEDTMYGKLAKELQEKSPTSPLKIRLMQVAKFISNIGYVGALLVSISYLFSNIVINNNFNIDKIIETITNFPLMFNHILYALTLSVTIIVVAVPEGLPMMITLVLSSNMKKMLKNNVLVRKLVGIETAGNLNVLITDKTGTITKGKLEVVSFYDGNLNRYDSQLELGKYKNLHNILNRSIIYNNSSIYNDNKEIVGGNITDRCLLSFSNPIDSNIRTIEKIPFSSRNKYSLTKIDDNNKKIILIKGASEKILPKCKYYYSRSGIKIPLEDKTKIKEEISYNTKQGIRVITLAEKISNISNLEDLTLIGFILIKDEIRPEAPVGIDLVTKAGINTIMITGDALDTAKSIAHDIGLLNNPNDIILTSNELNKMSDNDIKKIYKNIKVIARALPTDKSRLVTLGEELGLIVGMTGDGVNDAPALKKANVGFAIGSGTEVAKEASDIVILDDNFLSISKAILFGRTIFKSIRRFIIFQFTTNMCALTLSIIGPFIGINTPITIIQMLWLNMIMDTFAGIAFSYEAPLIDYMEESPKKRNEPIINKYMLSEIIVTGLYCAILCILFLKLPIINEIIRSDKDNKFLMTAYFAMFIFMNIFNAFNARSDRINIFSNILKNKVFICIFGFISLVQVFLIYNGGNLFRTYGLNVKEFIFILILSITVIPIDITRKYILRKKGIKKGV